MNARLLERIQAHLADDAVLTRQEWQDVLGELAADIGQGRPVDPLVVSLLDLEPERIDECLDRENAGRVLAFVFGAPPPSMSAQRRAAMGLDLVAAAAARYPARPEAARPALIATDEPGWIDRLLLALRPFVLVGAGVAAGVLIGMQTAGWRAPSGVAVASASPAADPSPGRSAAGETPAPMQLAQLFPGYSPEYYADAVDLSPKSLAVDASALQASLWFDRRDGAYREGDAVRLGYRVSKSVHTALLELSTEGRVQSWPLGNAPVVAGRSCEYPMPPQSMILEGPPGPEDLILVASTAPLPRSAIEPFLSVRAGPGGGERTELLEKIRDAVRAWAAGARVELAFSRAHATLSPRKR